MTALNRYLLSSLIAFAAAAVGTTASATGTAGDISIETSPFVSSASRADAQAELQQARAGGVNPWAKNYDPLAGFHSETSRTQVSAEYLKARAETAALTAEDSGSAWLALRARAVPASVVAGQPAAAQ